MGQRTRTSTVIIHIQFAATHDRFSIRVRESEFRVDMPNAARFNAEGLLAGFGEDEPQAGWTERPIYDPPRLRMAAAESRDTAVFGTDLETHEPRVARTIRWIRLGFDAASLRRHSGRNAARVRESLEVVVSDPRLRDQRQPQKLASVPSSP